MNTTEETTMPGTHKGKGYGKGGKKK